MNFDDTIAPLFALAPADFVAGRDALAAELKRSGNKDAARAVKAIAKPPASAYALNQLARRYPEILTRYLAAADAVRDAQAAGDRGADAAAWRRHFDVLLAEQREALAEARARSAELLGEVQSGDNRSVLDRIANNLRWGAHEQEVRAQLVAGTLRTDVAAPDFTSLAALAPDGAGVRPRPKLTLVPLEPAADDPSGQAARAEPGARATERAAAAREKALHQRREAVRALEADLRVAESRRKQAEKDIASAIAAHDRAEARLEQAKGELLRAEKELESANETLSDRRDKASAIAQTRQDLADELARARAALAELDVTADAD